MTCSSRYQQILSWCGESFDGLIILDNCTEDSFSSRLADPNGDSFVGGGSGREE